MPLTERLALLVSLDANGAIRGFENLGRSADKNLKSAEKRIDRVASGMQKAGAGMVGAAAIAATGLYKAGQAAADLEQAVGGTQAVFKETSSVIDKFAGDAAKQMGLSERAFREATTGIGGQLKGLGFDTDDAANRAIELTRVAADLAATYGGTTADAVSALGSALRGEADPAERFNLFLNQTRVNAKAVELGLAATTSSVDANAKAQAVLALVTEQSADALGQFGRESDTAAGQMQIASAEWENAKASLGESIAPIMADVAGGLSDITSGFADANEASGGLIGKLAGFGTVALGAAGGLSFVVGKVISMRENLGTLTGKLRNAEGGLTRLGKAAAGLGLAGAIAGAVQLARSMNDLEIDVEGLATAFGDLDGASREQQEGLVAASQQFGHLDDTVKQLAETNVLAADRFIATAESMGVQGKELAELKGIVDAKRDADKQGAKDQADYAAEVAGATGATEGLTGALQEEAEERGGLIGLLEAHQEALQGVLDATLAQFDANLGYKQSIDGVEGALADVHEAAMNAGYGSEEYRDALLEAEGAILSQADAALRLAEDQAEANNETLTAQEKARIYNDELIKLADTLAPGSQLRKQLDAYIFQLGAVPSTVNTLFTVSFDESKGANLGSGRVLKAQGGMVPQYLAGGGYPWMPQGSDTVPAMLTPGEFVIRKAAVDRLGPGFLSALNSGAVPGGGGTAVQQTNNFYNPVPEPASTSARRLRRAALDSAA